MSNGYGHKLEILRIGSLQKSRSKCQIFNRASIKSYRGEIATKPCIIFIVNQKLSGYSTWFAAEKDQSEEFFLQKSFFGQNIL